jgi:hypothetical protein
MSESYSCLLSVSHQQVVITSLALPPGCYLLRLDSPDIALWPYDEIPKFRQHNSQYQSPSGIAFRPAIDATPKPTSHFGLERKRRRLQSALLAMSLTQAKQMEGHVAPIANQKSAFLV